MKTLFLLGLMTLSLNVLANEKGNGGDGILIGGKPYLLDLVEYGTENGVDKIAPRCSISSYLETKLNASITVERGRSVILNKLNALCAVSPLAAASVALSSRLLTYSWVNLSLMDIADEESPIGFRPQDIVQLAARQEQRVLVDTTLWTKLDQRNKGALLLHEIIYSMLVFREEGGRKFQYSPDVRTIVGTLYSEDLENAGPELQNEILQKIGISVSESPVSLKKGELVQTKLNIGAISGTVENPQYLPTIFRDERWTAVIKNIEAQLVTYPDASAASVYLCKEIAYIWRNSPLEPAKRKVLLAYQVETLKPLIEGRRSTAQWITTTAEFPQLTGDIMNLKNCTDAASAILSKKPIWE
jgi:hypothetical protein